MKGTKEFFKRKRNEKIEPNCNDVHFLVNGSNDMKFGVHVYILKPESYKALQRTNDTYRNIMMMKL